jgi:hypothetical protein
MTPYLVLAGEGAMADTIALRKIGFSFLTITILVVLTATIMVWRHVDGSLLALSP